MEASVPVDFVAELDLVLGMDLDMALGPALDSTAEVPVMAVDRLAEVARKAPAVVLVPEAVRKAPVGSAQMVDLHAALTDPELIVQKISGRQTTP